MKILLLSDTHGTFDEKLTKYISESDEVWHAGDIGSNDVTDRIQKLKPLRAVHGNIDGIEIRSRFPEDTIFNSDDVKVWITHIGGYPGRYAKGIPAKLALIKPDLFICGHSHILKVMYDKSNTCLFMNPGAAGAHGFHQVRTAIRFQVKGKEITDLSVIELGKRIQH